MSKGVLWKAWRKGMVVLGGFLYLFLIGCLVLMVVPDVVLADEPLGETLFVDADPAEEALADEADEATVIRKRFVQINFSQLDSKERRNGETVVGEPLLLNLFEDTQFMAVLDEAKTNPSGSTTWQGRLSEVPSEQSQVTFVVKDGIMVGQIALPTAIYEIQYVGGDLHQIVQINQAGFPEEENDAILIDEQMLSAVEGRQTSSLSSTSDDGSVIDVLVLYTAESKRGAGGTTTAIESTIELAVAETNQAYQNSQVKQRLFLTHMAEVEYVEASNSTIDLSRLRLNSDGFMDEIHALRDEYHADTVVLIVEDGGGFCGVAYLMTSPAVSFADVAFSVVARACATGNYTFGHELGHNMGLNHDWYVNTRTVPYAHAHGYVNDEHGATWRTIMAYNSKCRTQGFYCTRLPYWSNPDLAHDGAATGVPSGTSTDCSAYDLENPPCDADNRLALDSTAAIVDQFRSSETVWLGHTSDWNDSENWSQGMVPRFMDDITIPGSPTGGEFPLIHDDLTIRDLSLLHGATLTMRGGTLTLLGNWREEDTATFDATAGTVQFHGYFDQTIQTGNDSHFHHLQIGDGSNRQTVTIQSDLTIEGNLDLMTGSSFQIEDQTIYLAGNWSDYNSTFDPQSSTLVLNGTTQVLRKQRQDPAGWDGALTFHNLTVDSTHNATIEGKMSVTNDLKINAGGLLNLATHALSVEGTVSNYGGLEQSQVVHHGTTEFLTIKNAAQSETKYYGLQIMPNDASAVESHRRLESRRRRVDGRGLGLTSVRLLGHQACTNNPSDPIIQRCFKITPTTPNPAQIRFWFTEAERNGVDADAIQIWNWKSHNNWFNLHHDASARYGSVDRCAAGVDKACWYELSEIKHYSLMSGGSTHPPTGHPTRALAGPLSTFMSDEGAEDVHLTWQIMAERNNIGFNLYRRTFDSQLSERIQLNSEPIVAQGAENRQTLSYQWKDHKLEKGKTFLYWLEEIDPNGTLIRHGPISISIKEPTTVHLNHLEASTERSSKITLLILLLLGLAMIQRRRDL